MALSKSAASAALTPAALGIHEAFESARSTTATMMAAADSTAFDSSVEGNVMGTLTWAAFASAAVGPMASVGERDLSTSRQSRIWTVSSDDDLFTVQMKSDIDDIREEQLSLFDQTQFTDMDATRRELVILSWNVSEPRFVLMRDGHVGWSIPVASMLPAADVVPTAVAPKRSVAAKDADRARERDSKSS